MPCSVPTAKSCSVPTAKSCSIPTAKPLFIANIMPTAKYLASGNAFPPNPESMAIKHPYSDFVQSCLVCDKIARYVILQNINHKFIFREAEILNCPQKVFTISLKFRAVMTPSPTSISCRIS